MSLKPMDFQVTVPRTLEVSRINNEEQSRHQSILQQQTSSTREKAEKDLKQVYKQRDSQEVSIREKQEKEKKNNKGKKDRKQKKKEQQTSRTTERMKIKKGGKIDIRL